MSKRTKILIIRLFYGYNTNTINLYIVPCLLLNRIILPRRGFFLREANFFSFVQDADGVLQLEIDTDGACSKSAGNRELRMDERSEDRQNSFFYIFKIYFVV
jgi:hypothetical protein